MITFKTTKTTHKILVIPILILVLSTISCSAMLYNMDGALRRKLAGLKEKSIVVNEFNMVYLEGGIGESVLLLHGFGADKDNWIRFAWYLKGDYHIVALDLPGFGESTMDMNQSYDIDSQVKRVHEFVRTMGMTKFHIAGNSMGGLIAGKYAAAYPKEILSLGLLDPGGVADRELSPLSRELKKGNNPLVVGNASDFDGLIDFVFFNPPFIPGTVKKYLGKKASARKAFLEKVFIEAKPGDQLESIMADIQVKTLIIWGDKDRVFPVSSASILDKGIKNSKLAIIKDCGHLPMMERPEETAKLYLDFLKENDLK